MADLFRPRLEGIFGPTMPVFKPAANLFGEPRAESDIGMEGRMQGQFESDPIQLSNNAPMNRMQEAYSPETYFQDLYRKSIEGMPQREEPSVLRRIASIFAPNQEEFKYAPYNRKLADWNMRREAIEPGLTAERYANTNERAIRSSEMQNEAANRRLDIQTQDLRRKEKVDEVKASQGEERLKIQKHRADTYRYRTENPNNQLTEDDKGNLMAFNPQTKAIEYLLDDDGQPIKGTALSEFDKLKLQIKSREELARLQSNLDLREEAQRQRNRLAEEEVRQRNRIELEREQGKQSRETKTTSPNEGNVQTTTSSVTVKDAEGKPQGTRTTTTQRSTQKGNNVGVKMKTPGGRIVLVPKDKVDEATKKGGKVVP
jgi:hypothetical protein